MSKGLMAQVSRLHTQEGELDYHSRLSQGMLNYSEQQRATVETLKAALRKDRFWLVWRSKKYTSVPKATAEADKQLASEYPEIFREEKE